jgi:hypothetical protein
MVQSQPRQIVSKILSQKYPTQKRAGGVAQVVDTCLASVSSNPSTTKKNDFWLKSERIFGI